MSTTCSVAKAAVCAACGLVLLGASPKAVPNSHEDLLAAREAATGRPVDPLLRPALLERMGGLDVTQAIGEPDASLVFTPLTPCRIADTRVPTSGILEAGVERAFVVAGDSPVFQLQGGKAGGCSVPVGATAVMLNLVATGSAGPGNLSAIPWTSSDPVWPTSSVLNFGSVTGLFSIANGLALPVCDPAAATCTYDLFVRAQPNSTHFVADVVGYFSGVTGVVQTAQSPLQVSGASVRLSSAGCSAGYVWKWTGSSWACSQDANTTYSTAAPLSLSGTSIGLSSSGCGSGYVWKWTGSSWSCSPDNNTTYGAGMGLDMTGTTLSVDAYDFMRVPTLAWTSGSYSLGTSWTTVISGYIYAPQSGRILAIASGTIYSAGNQTVHLLLTNSAEGTTGPSGYLYFSASEYKQSSTMAAFDVSGGSTTYVYLRGYHTSSSYSSSCVHPKIALMFFPN